MATKTNTKNGGKKATKAKQEQTLQDLLVIKMQALLDVETELVKALPAMAKHATDPDLKKGFQDHLEQTKGHVKRLERGFSTMGIAPKKLKGDAIRGLVSDAKWVMQNVKGDKALDANLVAAAQYVEHYEMAGYMAALDWAHSVGNEDVADLLEMTLEEEKDTADKLTQLAETKINEAAVGSNEDENM